MIRMAIQVVLVDEAGDRRDVHEIVRIDRGRLCHLRARGEKIPSELMPYVAPLGWQHINLTGTISGQSRRDSTARASARSPRLQARPTPMFLICPLSVVFCPFYVVTPFQGAQ